MIEFKYQAIIRKLNPKNQAGNNNTISISDRGELFVITPNKASVAENNTAIFKSLKLLTLCFIYFANQIKVPICTIFLI